MRRKAYQRIDRSLQKWNGSMAYFCCANEKRIEDEAQ